MLGGLSLFTGLIVIPDVIQTEVAAQEPTPGPGASQLRKLLLEEPDIDLKQILEGIPEAQTLAARQIELADEMLRLCALELIEPPTPSEARGTFTSPLRSYLEWSSRRLEPRLSLAKSDEERVRLLATEVHRLRELEKIYGELAKGERVTVTPRNLLELEYHRLELESRLAKTARPQS